MATYKRACPTWTNFLIHWVSRVSSEVLNKRANRAQCSKYCVAAFELEELEVGELKTTWARPSRDHGGIRAYATTAACTISRTLQSRNVHTRSESCLSLMHDMYEG